jgi:hypothetical protein
LKEKYIQVKFISYLNWPCSSFRSIVWNQTPDQNVLFWYMPYINVYMFWLLGHGIYSKCTPPGQCKAIDIVLLDNQQLSCLSQDITSNQVGYGPITVIPFFFIQLSCCSNWYVFMNTIMQYFPKQHTLLARLNRILKIESDWLK